MGAVAKSTIPTPLSAEVATPCPRCQGRLIDPGGLGWCEKCGYCKSLTENVPSQAAEPAAPASPKAGEVWAALLLPSWAWLLLLGTLLFAGTSYFVGRNLAKYTFERALWSTLQIAAGLFVVLAAQFWAVVALAHKDETIGFKDVFLPARLWALVVRNLPTTRWHLWLGVWGLTLILGACIFVGGLSHWMTYLPGQKNAPGNTRSR